MQQNTYYSQIKKTPPQAASRTRPQRSPPCAIISRHWLSLPCVHVSYASATVNHAVPQNRAFEDPHSLISMIGLLQYDSESSGSHRGGMTRDWMGELASPPLAALRESARQH